MAHSPASLAGFRPSSIASPHAHRVPLGHEHASAAQRLGSTRRHSATRAAVRLRAICRPLELHPRSARAADLNVRQKHGKTSSPRGPSCPCNWRICSLRRGHVVSQFDRGPQWSRIRFSAMASWWCRFWPVRAIYFPSARKFGPFLACARCWERNRVRARCCGHHPKKESRCCLGWRIIDLRVVLRRSVLRGYL
jgi:hypothetical protein